MNIFSNEKTDYNYSYFSETKMMNKKELVIYRLFEKNDDIIDLIGTTKYFINLSDIFKINYEYDIFIGKNIENINNYDFSRENLKLWLEECEFEFINNSNMYIKKFIYKNNIKKEINTVRLCYTSIIPDCYDWDKIDYIDENLNELIVTNLLNNRNILKTNDKIILNELMGENSYIKNNELKFLFKFKKINI